MGQTKRALKTMIKEHFYNLKHSVQNHSVLTKHIYLNYYNIDWVNVKTLDEDNK